MIATALLAWLAAVAPPAGTEIELMVLAEVNSRVSRPGSPVSLRVNRAVERDGVVLVPVGTTAHGRVEALTRSAIAGQRGSITVRLVRVDGPDGPIALDPAPIVRQARGGGADDVAKLLLAPFYAPFSPANSAKLKAGDILVGRTIAAPDAPR